LFGYDNQVHRTNEAQRNNALLAVGEIELPAEMTLKPYKKDRSWHVITSLY